MRSRVRALVADGRTGDALEVVMERLSSLSRRSDDLARAIRPAIDATSSTAGAEIPDELLPSVVHEPIEADRSTLRRRRSTLETLPRVAGVSPAIDPDSCPRCRGPARTLGWSVCERLELSSASQLRVEVDRVPEIGCDRCGAWRGPDVGGIGPGPRLLAHVVVAAHGDGVTFARQAVSYRRVGAAIGAAVMERWSDAVADALAPIAREIRRRALASAVLVVRAAGPFGVLVGDDTWCVVDASRASATLSGRQGWIVTDDVSGGRRDEVASWDPVRRALVALVQDGDTHAPALLALVQRLYQIERSATDDHADAEERQRRRERRSRPVLDQLRRVCVEVYGSAPPFSPLATTITGVLSQWEALGRFVDDGRLPLDGAVIDRVERAIAALREPMVIESSANVDRRATLATVLGTCELASVAPVEYLAGVLCALEQRVPRSRIGELLPPLWTSG